MPALQRARRPCPARLHAAVLSVVLSGHMFSTAADSLGSQLSALTTLRDETNGDQWTNQWPNSVLPCDWFGVRCNPERNRVM